MAVDVKLRERFRVAVQRPVLGVCERLLLAEAAQVGLAPPRGVVACRTAYKTALAVPEACLTVVASVPCNVRTLLGVHANEGVDGVARQWLRHRAMARGERESREDSDYAEHGGGDGRLRCPPLFYTALVGQTAVVGHWQSLSV